MSLRATRALALATFRSTTRSRLSVMVLVFGVALLMVTSLMTAGSLHEEARLMRNLGLFLGSLLACLSTLIISAQSLYRDLERKSLFTIATKPISRGVIIWGKYLGVALTSAALVTLMTLAWFTLAWRLGVTVDLMMLKAWWLVWVESIVIGAVAMLFGSFSTPLIASLLALGVMVIGRFSAEIIQLQERAVKLDESSFPLELARGLLEILPPLHLYNVTEEVVYGVNLPSSYWVNATLTGLTYSAICLALAQVIFQRRDLT